MKQHKIGFASAIAMIISAASSGQTDPRLIHHFRFDADASDSAGSAHGQLMNGAVVQDGMLFADGVDDYVQLPVHAIPTSGPFTVALRFKLLSLPWDYMELISQGYSTGPAFYIGCDPSHQWRDWHDDSSVTHGPFPAPGAWHHVAVVYRPGAVSQLFVDGALWASRSAPPMTDQGTPTRLARQVTSNHEFFHGYLDEVRIYSAALAADEIEALSNDCPADINNDDSVNGADISVLLGYWGQSGKLVPGDINRDGTVDAQDLSMLLGSWGPCP